MSALDDAIDRRLTSLRNDGDTSLDSLPWHAPGRARSLAKQTNEVLDMFGWFDKTTPTARIDIDKLRNHLVELVTIASAWADNLDRMNGRV